MTRCVEYSPDGADESHTDHCYPNTVIEHIRHPFHWFDFNNNTQEITDLINEINTAITFKLFRIAAMGIRTLVMQIVNKATGSNFDKFGPCLAYLEQNNHVTPDQRNMLEQSVELGHSAVHRNHSPTQQQVEAAVSIVNAFSTLLIQIKRAAGIIETGIPQHTAKKKRPVAIAAPPSPRRYPQGGCGAPGSRRPPRGPRRKR
ncbi:DUF4145 domain-containing protein [Humidesulfovibrio idahonensis]